MPRVQRLFGSTWTPVQGNRTAAKMPRLVHSRHFAARLNLPAPMVISSGSGLHVYWPLNQALDRPTWERYAHGLKYLCERHGLQADPARTADISSVLRTPGTRNRKRHPVQIVECDQKCLEILPYGIEYFNILVESSPAAAGSNVFPLPFRRVRLGQPNGLKNRPPRKLLEGLEKLGEFEAEHPPAYGAEIVKQCRQLQEFRDKSGNIPEPIWYANIGVLAFCEGGDTLAHEYSSGRYRYSFEETQARLDRHRGFGPTTCAHFHSVNPVTCEQCRVRGTITSPIQLGRRSLQPLADTGNGLCDQATRIIAPLDQWELTKGGAVKPNSYNNACIALSRLGIIVSARHIPQSQAR